MDSRCPLPFCSLANISLQGTPIHLRPWTLRPSPPSRRPRDTPPIPGRSNNGSPVAPRRGRGACLCATYTRARAPAHPRAFLCTVARWIVFASSSRKSPRPTPTHPCLCLVEHLVLVISRGKGCGGLWLAGARGQGVPHHSSGLWGQGAHPPARLEAVGMPTTHAVACPFSFNFLFCVL